MQKLTAKEEAVMRYFWESDGLFVKQLLERYPEPKPHVNTLSTYVRILEDKGFLSHLAFGPTYRYHAVISEEEYRNGALKNVVRKYFDNSCLSVVSSVDEVRRLLDEVEKDNASSATGKDSRSASGSGKNQGDP